MGYFVKNRQLQSGSSGVVLPAGPASTRPNDPVFGLMRFNTDSGLIEYFNGTVYTSVMDANVVYSVDNFTGDGITSIFTMSQPVSIATDIIVFVGSIYQQANTVYTVNGGYDITFTSAPPLNVSINVIHTNNAV